MPGLETHSERCNERYGYEFRDIHIWMDETVKIKGPKHREDRHDPFETPEKAEEIFWEQVPEQYRKFIPDAVKDHIRLDNKKVSHSQESNKQYRVGIKVKYKRNEREYKIKERSYNRRTGFYYYDLKSETYSNLRNVRADHIECIESGSKPTTLSELVRKYEGAYSNG